MFFSDEAGTKALKAVIRTDLAAGGPQIQFNVIDTERLRDAKEHQNGMATSLFGSPGTVSIP